MSTTLYYDTRHLGRGDKVKFLSDIAHYTGLQGSPSVEIEAKHGHLIVEIEDENAALATKIKFTPVPESRFLEVKEAMDRDEAAFAAAHAAFMASTISPVTSVKVEDEESSLKDTLIVVGFAAAIIFSGLFLAGSVGFTLWTIGSKLWGLV